MVVLTFGHGGHELHDLRREVGRQHLQRVLGVLDDVVQQRGGEDFVIVDPGSQQDHRGMSRMRDVRQIAPLAVMMPMSLRAIRIARSTSGLKSEALTRSPRRGGTR